MKNNVQIQEDLTLQEYNESDLEKVESMIISTNERINEINSVIFDWI